jgi:ABC-type multidrug transport system fused ATPase/permease subunit
MIKKILGLLTSRERRQGYMLLGMIIFMALLETGGVASILPFMSVLANPEVVKSNVYLATVYNYLEFEEPQAFLFFLGIVVFTVLVVSVAFKALTTYAVLRFAHMRNYSLSKRVVASYLRQPYEWFLNRHSADLGKTVLSEVFQVVNGVLIPMMQLIAHGAVALALIVLLIVVDPKLAVFVALVLGGAYGVIYLLLRHYLVRIGKDRVKANRERFEVVQEVFGGVKEVKVSGLEGAMLRRFDGPAKRFARHQASSQVASQQPRFIMEIIAFGGMLAIMLFMMTGPDGLQQTLPIITLYAFAGYRLMPALQQIYANLSKMRFTAPALDDLHGDIGSLNSEGCNNLSNQKAQPLGLSRSIYLEAVHYSYPGSERSALDNLILNIPAYSTVGLVGSTGSGKTTTVDIILGLLRPQSGQLKVDDKPITPENVRAWQRNIGYVPQHIFLADSTVAANIAFGLPPEQIDQMAVERAARIANLHNFVVNDLPNGYATAVGERGVRLSGGQRQRIGIARCLYHDPEVIVLDEATSALDNVTEQAVMQAVHKLTHSKTIIIIAHRLSTIRECDCIYLLERGQVVGEGTYEKLVATNKKFRDMAGTESNG